MKVLCRDDFLEQMPALRARIRDLHNITIPCHPTIMDRLACMSASAYCSYCERPLFYLPKNVHEELCDGR